MDCHFTVGQKVVALKSDWRDEVGMRDEGHKNPVEGSIYTIKQIEVHCGEVFVFLEECDHLSSYLASKFRPVNTRKTDISVFTDILIKPKQPIPA